MKWKHRSIEEKKKILAKTRGYPYIEELEAYANKIPERIRLEYFMDWLRFHKNLGVYDKETLAEFYGYLMYAEKMRRLGPDGGTFEKDALPDDYKPSWEKYKQEYLQREFQVKDHVQEG